MESLNIEKYDIVSDSNLKYIVREINLLLEKQRRWLQGSDLEREELEKVVLYDESVVNEYIRNKVYSHYGDELLSDEIGEVTNEIICEYNLKSLERGMISKLLGEEEVEEVNLSVSDEEMALIEAYNKKQSMNKLLRFTHDNITFDSNHKLERKLPLKRLSKLLGVAEITVRKNMDREPSSSVSKTIDLLEIIINNDKEKIDEIRAIAKQK